MLVGGWPPWIRVVLPSSVTKLSSQKQPLHHHTSRLLPENIALCNICVCQWVQKASSQVACVHICGGEKRVKSQLKVQDADSSQSLKSVNTDEWAKFHQPTEILKLNYLWKPFLGGFNNYQKDDDIIIEKAISAKNGSNCHCSTVAY